MRFIWSLALSACILHSCTLHAQGLTYFSSIDPSTALGALPVGSDAWVAYRFNSLSSLNGFYRLDAIRVRLEAGSDPNALQVAVYQQNTVSHLPGNELGTLFGPTSVEGDIATYEADGLSLKPVTRYYVVFTAKAPINAHAVSLLGSAGVADDFVSKDGWFLYEAARSVDGLDWSRAGFSVGRPQLAIVATLVPEPSSLPLFILGGALLLLVQRKRRGAEHSAR